MPQRSPATKPVEAVTPGSRRPRGEPRKLLLAAARDLFASQDYRSTTTREIAEAAGVTELEDLFVHPGWMRRGIATALVNQIAQVLRARGVERLEVTANPDAIGFYRAAGFLDCGSAETHFGPAPRMALALR